MDVLKRMMDAFQDEFHYSGREAEGTQAPGETLRTRSGTCRDYAWLMIERAVFRRSCPARLPDPRFVMADEDVHRVGASRGPSTMRGRSDQFRTLVMTSSVSFESPGALARCSKAAFIRTWRFGSNRLHRSKLRANRATT